MPDAEESSARLGFTFTETMGGFIASGEHEYSEAEKIGKQLGDSLRFTVTITIEDLDAFRHDDRHEAKLSGSIDAVRFGGVRPIEEGVFNLFVEDERGHKQMRYRIFFRGQDGHRYRLDGFKDVHDDHVIDFWTDTTTLFTTVRHVDVADEPIVATGMLYIRAIDLVPQVLSMRSLGAANALQQVEGLAKFGMFFTERMLNEYANVRKLTALLHHRSSTEKHSP